MEKLLNSCERAMIYVSALSTFILMILTTADAVGRYLFNHPITGAYEISSNYLMVAAVFMAAGYGYREGAYIRVTFLADRLPDEVKLGVNYFVQLLSVIYGLLLVVTTIQQTKRIFFDHTTLSSLNVPLWPAYALVPAGLFFMSLLMLLDIRKVKEGKSALFTEESPTA